VQPLLSQLVGELLDARLVLDGRELVVLARRSGIRVFAVLAMHPEQVLGAHVVGLEVVVGDRPGRSHALGVAHLAEVLRCEAP